jgi:hypothetical protein
MSVIEMLKVMIPRRGKIGRIYLMNSVKEIIKNLLFNNNKPHSEVQMSKLLELIKRLRSYAGRTGLLANLASIWLKFVFQDFLPCIRIFPR